jgi:segregation and condensation protein B
LRAFELIEKSGELEAPGRPSLYVTTEFFLDYIGINQLEELPEVDESRFEAEQQILFNESEQNEN